jgi:hypothetical protein
VIVRILLAVLQTPNTVEAKFGGKMSALAIYTIQKHELHPNLANRMNTGEVPYRR